MESEMMTRKLIKRTVLTEPVNTVKFDAQEGETLARFFLPVGTDLENVRLTVNGEEISREQIAINESK